MSKDIIKCTATVNRVLFPNGKLRSGDFGIVSMNLVKNIEGEVELHPQYKNFVVKGTFCELNQDDEYRLTLKEVMDDKWGLQYEIIFINTKVNLDTIADQKKFLMAVTTDKIIEALYEELENPLEALENGNVELLCTVKGIGKKIADRLIRRYEVSKDNADVFIKLKDYELTECAVKKLMAKYKSVDTILHKLREDIYILAEDIDGMGFKTVDSLAMKFGMEFNNPRRVRAFIMHHLKEEANNGNSWVFTQELLKATFETCGDVDLEVVRNILTELRENDTVTTNDKRTIIGLKDIYDIEVGILKEIERISSTTNRFDYEGWERVVDEIESNLGWKYTEQQRKGVQTVLENQFSIITGLGGTGKTTVSNAMVKVLSQKGYKTVQCALSGKASLRLTQMNGLESYTIHRLLGIGFGEKESKHNEKNPIDADIIILDEASMPDARLILKLLKAIKTGSKVVIMGDKGQLPSIGIGNVFFDLLEMTSIPVVTLDIIHRQAQASAIISKSIDVRNKKQLFDKDFEGNIILGELQDLELNVFLDKSFVFDKVIKQFIKHYEINNCDIMKVQVISATKSRGDISTKNINRTIQMMINPNAGTSNGILLSNGLYVHEGDKVINNTNTKTYSIDGKEVFVYNGNLGIVEKIDKEGNVIVNFKDLNEVVILECKHVKDNIDLAYSITCHKLQGSSAHTVIIALDYSAYTLLSCEYVYTAITRAEKYAIVCAEGGALRKAISTTHSSNKQTFIKIKNQQEKRHNESNL